MNYALEIENLSKAYPSGVKALEHLSCKVEAGSLFGFIGPDGAGKTTLFRILTTLLLPDEGKVNLLGLDLIHDYKKIRQSLGYMPGQFSLYQDLSVEENLNFFAGVFKTNLADNYHLIEDIYKQIEPFKHRRAGKLSGGMKQKLALSCALIHKPQMLFLDEPTTGVDAVSRKEFWQMLHKLRDGGLTIIVSTPYMDEAALCDQVALIQKGKILSINTPQEIIKSFPLQLFALKSTDNYPLLKVLQAEESVHSVWLFGESLHLSLKGNLSIESFKTDINRRFPQLTFEVEEIEAGIEDCFMELMYSHGNRS